MTEMICGVRVHWMAAGPRLLEGEELETLVASIRTVGLIDPLTRRWIEVDGERQPELLDGRNRLLACEAAGIEPTWIDFAGTDLDAERFIEARYGARRDESKSQKALVAARWWDFYRRIAAANQGTRNDLTSSEISLEVQQVRDLAGRGVGVGGNLVQWARNVLVKAEESPTAEHVVDLVREGRVTLDIAAKVVLLSEDDMGRFVDLVVANNIPARKAYDQVAPVQGSLLSTSGQDFPTPREEEQAQKIEELTHELREKDQQVDELKQQLDEVSTALEEEAPERASGISNSKGYDSDEWYTPAQYLDAAREVMGAIDLDPATCPVAQVRVRAKRHFTKDDDGLSQEWSGRVWLNPPYSQPAATQFADKLLTEYAAGRVKQAVMVQNSGTDTAWFHRVAAKAWICVVKGRINFDREDGGSAANRYAQVFFYLGPNHERFCRVFGRFGLVGKLESHDQAA